MKELKLIAKIEKDGACPILWFGNDCLDFYRIEFEKLPLVDFQKWSSIMTDDIINLDPEYSEVWIHPDYKETITDEIAGEIEAYGCDIINLKQKVEKYQKLQKRLEERKKYSVIVTNEEWVKLKSYLIDHKIKFDSSGCFEGVCVQYEITEDEKQSIDVFLEEMRGENNGKDNGSKSK